MQLTCPQGHGAVVRNDPKSTGLIGMCDVCGWSAPYAVAREQGEYQPDPEARIHPGNELRREQLTAGSSASSGTRRRSDREE